MSRRRALPKRLGRAIRAVPRGFNLPCGFPLSPGRSKPKRALCERAGLLYEVRGNLAAIDQVLCPRHRDRLISQGLKLRLAPPIAQAQVKTGERRILAAPLAIQLEIQRGRIA